MSTTRNERRLVSDIAKMVGDQTWNHAPVNYTVAEKAIEIVTRRRVRPLQKALREIRSYAEAWADPATGDAILTIIDGLKNQPFD